MRRKITRINTNKTSAPLRLCAMLFFFSLLIANCSLPEMHAPRSGYLYISVDTGMRTIRPENIQITNYQLFIDNAPSPVDFNNTGSFAVPLEHDKTYKVEVKAYNANGIIAVGSEDFYFSSSTPSVTILLKPNSATGTGTFSWKLDFDGFTPVSVKMNFLYYPEDTPIDNTEIELFPDFLEEQCPLPTGFYYVVLDITKDAISESVIWKQVLHIYENLTSHFEFKFTEKFFEELAVPSGLVVTNLNDTTNTSDPSYDGSLRWAITNAQDGDTITFADNLVTPGVSEIELRDTLSVNRSIKMTIEGGGIILTRHSSWISTSYTSQLMYINNVSAEIKLISIYFKDGKTTDYGAGIRNNGKLTLESCIFNGNQSTNFASYGGAIYSSGTISVKGCTFYQNVTGSMGGAVLYNAGGIVMLYGNLIYGNIASSYPIIRNSSGDLLSQGYNVVDVAFGTGTNQAGWTAGTGDIQITTSPFVTTVGVNAFTVLNTGTLHTHIPQSFASNMPDVDFYGNLRTWPNAPGAVQWVGSLPDDTSIFSENFEDAVLIDNTLFVNGKESFTIINGSQINKWLIDTATARESTKSAYISSSGNNYTYNVNSASTVHMYKDIDFPASSNPYLLTFDWQCQGEQGYDYLQVFLISIGTTPVAGTQLTTGKIGTTYDTGGNGTWNTANIFIPAFSLDTTMRLVFSWRNDNSGGSQPPAAIDNIEIVESPYLVLLEEDFEGTTYKFTIENGSQTNKWHVGTATASGGSKSAYISNNNGTGNAYTLNSASVVHMYSDILFPASSTPYYLTFNWKCQGLISSGTNYDYLQVSLVATNTIPAAGVELTANQIGAYNRGGFSKWNDEVIIIPAYSNSVTMRLVFTWINGGSIGGDAPPAAIDNIVIYTERN